MPATKAEQMNGAVTGVPTPTTPGPSIRPVTGVLVTRPIKVTPLLSYPLPTRPLTLSPPIGRRRR